MVFQQVHGGPSVLLTQSPGISVYQLSIGNYPVTVNHDAIRTLGVT